MLNRPWLLWTIVVLAVLVAVVSLLTRRWFNFVAAVTVGGWFLLWAIRRPK